MKKNDRKMLVIATVPLRKDGLTAVLIRMACIAGEDLKIDFALGEGADPEIISLLKDIGDVYELPSRKKHLFGYMKSLKKLARKEAYDIVHIHGNTATMAFDLIACRSIRIRITHCHNRAKQPKLKQMILGTIMNRLVTIPAACSQKAGEAIYTKPFTVITNGIDTELFHFSSDKRKEVREQLGLQNAFVIGHIGTFNQQKNHERLIRIFAKALDRRPDAILLLCGTGELETETRKQVHDMNLEDKVIFAGIVPDPQRYLMAMDVLVMPSLFEGLPLVGIEAQATGLPCVFADTITDETAIIQETEFVSLHEPDEKWAEIICKDKVVHREEAAEQIKKAGYDLDTVRKQVKALYGLG